MRKKINRRFTIFVVISIIITAVAVTALSYILLKRQVFSDLHSMAVILENSQFPSDDFKDIRVTIIEKDGSVSFDSKADVSTMENHLDRPEIAQAIKEGSSHIVRESDTMAESIFYYALRYDDGRIIRVGKASDSVFLLYISILPIVIIVIIILVLISMISSHYLTVDILRPINCMAENLDQINEDNVYEELIPFAQKIRGQHEEILASANIRQEFTANVSHELKTPLAAISGYAELMENGMVPQNEMKHFCGEIRKSATRLLILINDILKLSELDAGRFEELEFVDLADIADNTVKMLEIGASKNRVKLSYEGEKGVFVRVGKEFAEELTYNLIENAIRYNKPGGTVIVSVRKEDQRIVFTVKDTGIGISKEHQERIFERFYRVDKSRSKELGGTGLGLAIVKHICELTAGELQLESEIGKGTEITLCWGGMPA